MGKARWTVDGDTQSLVWQDGNGGTADVAVWIIEGYPDQEAAFDALVAAVRDAARIPQFETRLRQLEDALLLVVAELPVEQTLLLRAEVPRLADFISHLHHSIEHEQAMVRRNVWADLPSSPSPQGEGT